MASEKVDLQTTDDDEPKSKKLKLDLSEDINADCPLFQLPDDILTKIISSLPIAQWPDLELVSKKFRDITYLAWRSLRHVNLKEDFMFEPNNDSDEIWNLDFMSSMEFILQKLTKRAPFIKSLSGVTFQTDNPNSNATTVGLLSRFENLETISFVRHRLLLRYRCMDLSIRAEDLITFVESTRSRTKLKEIKVEHYVVDDIEQFLRAFALRSVQTDLANNSDDQQQRMRLEKLVVNREMSRWWQQSTIDWRGILTLLDNSKLTTLSLGASPIEPDILSNLIQSAPNLHHLGFAFACCGIKMCKGPHAGAYKRLMDTLTNHQTLNELHFFETSGSDRNCLQFEAEFVQMLKLVGPRLCSFAINLDDALFKEKIFDVEQLVVIIYNYMRALKSIHLRVDCYSISKEDIKRIVALQCLEDISLVSVLPQIDEATIATIGRSDRLKHLRVCELHYNPTPQIIASSTYLGLATLTTLTKLDINNAGNISSDTFESWGNVFGPTLEELRLSTVDKDARRGLVALITKADRLRVLDLQICMVTQQILNAVATSCPNLEFVGEVNNCLRGTLVALQKIVDACPKLMELRTTHYEFRQYFRENLRIDKYRNICIHAFDLSIDYEGK